MLTSPSSFGLRLKRVLMKRTPLDYQYPWLVTAMVSGRLFEEFLRRADLTGNDALPYKHVKFTWYEKRRSFHVCVP